MRERTSHMGLHIHVLRQRAKIFNDYGIIIGQWQRMENREREGLRRSKNNGKGRNLNWGEKQTKKRER